MTVAAGVSESITGRTRLFGVIGDPIRHSMSPALLNAAFRSAGLDCAMLAMPVARSEIGAAIAGLRSLGIEGCSVTMPHKADVIAHLDRCSAEASALNAVNCVRRDGSVLIGENTDGAGFLAALTQDAGFEPAGRHCVVVGAGGAARAVIVALAGAGASRVSVVNRSPDSAATAASLAGAVGSVADTTIVRDADLVVQATPIGMAEGDPSAVDAALFRSGQVLVDLIYVSAMTPTMSAAERAGVQVFNGLSMLVNQAAVAFEHWTGQKADIGAMRHAGP